MWFLLTTGDDDDDDDDDKLPTLRITATCRAAAEAGDGARCKDR